MAKIAAAGEVLGANLGRNCLRFGNDLRRENVRKVMLANDDFDVHAHFAVAAKDLDDAAHRRSASTRKASELHVHDSAVEFRKSQAAAGAHGFGWRQSEFLAKRGSQFVTGRNDDFMGNARFVGKDNVGVRTITEEANDGGILAGGDFFDAAFEAPIGTAANDACEDPVTVHGTAYGVGGNEKIAVHAGDGMVRHHETVSVAMSDKTTGNDVSIVAAKMAFTLCRSGWRDGCGGLSFGARAYEAKFAVLFVDVAAAFQLRKHFGQSAASPVTQLHACGDFADALRMVRTRQITEKSGFGDFFVARSGPVLVGVPVSFFHEFSFR